MYLKTENMNNFLIDQEIASGDKIEVENRTEPLIMPEIEALNYKLEHITVPCTKEIRHEVEITCIFSPYFFYLHLCKEKKSFSIFEEEIQKFYEINYGDYVLRNPRVGQVCIAQYSEDLAWYRAVVKEIDDESNTVKVFFLDYGKQIYLTN